MTSERLKTINIKGKEYVEVFERVRYFRESGQYEGYAMLDEIVSHEAGRITIKTTIYTPEGKAVATGMASEVEGSTYINKTSYVENCETSAWGRALANLGIGVSNAVASAEEIQNAMLQQEELKKAKKEMEENSAAFDRMLGGGEKEETVCPICGRKIESATGKNGKTWTPGAILKRYGMCKECYEAQLKGGGK